MKVGWLKGLLLSIGLCGSGQVAFAETDAGRCVPDDTHMCAIFRMEGRSHLMTFQRVVIPQAVEKCEQDDFESCVYSGSVLSQATGVDRDLKTAAQVLGRACLANHAEGCHELGQMLWESTDRKEEAFDALSRGCELGFDHACLSKATPMEEGVGGTAEDAYAIYRDHCEGGSLDGCQSQAVLLKHGKGVPQNSEKAASMFERLCEQGLPSACFRLATMHFHEEARSNDPKRINDLLTFACQETHADACGFLGVTMIIANNNEIMAPAKQAIIKGCDLGSSLSCDFMEKATSQD